MRVPPRCSECNKARAILSEKKPTRFVLAGLDTYVEVIIYTCGDPLFNDDIARANTFYVRRALVCFTSRGLIRLQALP